MSRLVASAIACLALAAGSMDTVQSRLSRGDARGAARALEGLPRPPADRVAELAAWLDAHARVAWAQGRMDEAFARAALAQAFAERAGVALPPLDAAFGGGRAWIDAETGLPVRVLPTGDSGQRGAELGRELLAAAEGRASEGAWLAWAAKLLDASVAPPAIAPRAAKETAAEAVARRRVALLQAACQARAGDAAQAGASLRAAARDGEPMRGFALWFDGEALSRDGVRRDPRLAALRFAQAAAEFDASPWMRVAALRRAADTLEPIDAPEAARLRAAADKETP